jgi:beta-1,4-mannosyltransferase
MRGKVFVFPKESNPYQELLYSAIQSRYGDRIQIRYCRSFRIIGPSLFIPFALIYRALGYRILHIHWPAFVLLFGRHRLSGRPAYYYFLICLSLIRVLRYDVIWTVHNLLPHEPQTDNDLDLIKKLAKSASAKIAHNLGTVESMRKLQMDTNGTNIIPIGSYSNVYPDVRSPIEARHILNIPIEDVVVLFFGIIRPYKGLDDLLRIFQRDLPARLIIAGKPADDKSAERIKEACAQHNIDFYGNYIPDEDVSVFFRACDVVCLPFRKVTTTSSALLAMSFAKPLIAPRLGAIQDFPKNTGIYYDEEDPEGLYHSISEAIDRRERLPALGENALTYSKSLSWEAIADSTFNLYQQFFPTTHNIVECD